jgi:hypothetical protein
MTFEVGYAQEIITPSLARPVYLAGFGQNRAAETVHDDLYARALALSLAEIQVVVMAVDLIGLGRHHCTEVEARLNAVAPGATLVLSCTHTHHGPDTIGLWGPDVKTSGVDPAYIQSLKDKLVTAARSALDDLEPALMRASSLPVTGLAKNARAPEILDQELACLQFCDPEEGGPLVNWLVYPCHPEVLGDQNPHITSDYLDATRREVEAETSAPCLAMVGALGGMMTPDVEQHTFAEAEQMGQALARAALEVLRDSPEAPVERLRHLRHEYIIPMTNPIFRIAMEGGFLPDLLNADGTVTTEANLLKVGPTWLFGVPGELFPELGLAFKRQMLDAGAFEPGAHYEETMSMGPEAGPRLRAALETLLAQA